MITQDDWGPESLARLGLVVAVTVLGSDSDVLSG
jgi:hypothetical protein